MRLISHPAIAFLLACTSGLCHADYKEDIGYSKLLSELGIGTPDGSGVWVTQVEANTGFVDYDDGGKPEQRPVYLPDPNTSQFLGKTITDKTGLPSGTFSGHATSVGTTFFGNTSSIAPGISDINAHWAERWLGADFLQGGDTQKPPATSRRIGNHSWVGNIDTAAIDSDILRKIDWVIETDEFIQAAGHIGPGNPLLGSAYNVIAVTFTNNTSSAGSAQLDGVYNAGRTRPDIVAPMNSPSSATPVVAAAAALLVEVGHAVPSLSTDPDVTATTNRNGDTIRNAERSEVIKAVLMAGADRVTENGSGANIDDYRVDSANKTDNGLDARYGAGQVNPYNSYHIQSAGEQNSDEDDGAGLGQIGIYGFDYDPSFGGSGSSNTGASYYFSTGASPGHLTASLVWNIDIDGGSGSVFSGAATLHDLDLLLYDETGSPILVAASSSLVNNTENIWTSLDADSSYSLKVIPKSGQAPFEWDYALAWHITSNVGDDADGDGVADVTDNCPEISNADQLDTDADSEGDTCDTDDDNDGLTDDWEIAYNLDPLDGADASMDGDADGLSNLQEYVASSNPGNPDTDNDGLIDGAEVNTYGTDPTDADTDNDGLNDGYEIMEGFNPLDDTDCPDRICNGSRRGWRLGLGL